MSFDERLMYAMWKSFLNLKIFERDYPADPNFKQRGPGTLVMFVGHRAFLYLAQRMMCTVHQADKATFTIGQRGPPNFGFTNHLIFQSNENRTGYQ